jgi:uncharacterized protein CbrC (UPF0167 family)
MTALPSFKYHPDPIATKVFERLNEPCDCCGEVSEYLYTPAVYSSHIIDGLCPWCIASGKAHEKFEAIFTPNVGEADTPLVEPWAEVPAEVRSEIEYRTPGFAGYQEQRWWTHCADGAAFIGYVGDLPKEIFLQPQAARFVKEMKKLHQLSDEDWQWFIGTPDKEHSITFYVFRCLHCGEVGGYGDFT